MIAQTKYVRIRTTLVDGVLICGLGALFTLGYKINDKLSLLTENRIEQKVINANFNKSFSDRKEKDKEQDAKIDELFMLVFDRPKEIKLKNF